MRRLSLWLNRSARSANSFLGLPARVPVPHLLGHRWSRSFKLAKATYYAACQRWFGNDNHGLRQSVQGIGTVHEHGVSSPGFPGFFLDGRSPFLYDARAQEERQPAKLRPGAVAQHGGLNTAIMELQPS